MSTTRQREPDTCCSQCGGVNVQHAVWMESNTGLVLEHFGTPNFGDNTYCADCDDATDLVSAGVDADRFRSLRANWRRRNRKKKP